MGSNSPLSSEGPLQSRPVSGEGNVRYGSLADFRERARDVRFTSKSGHVQHRSRCPLCATSGHQGLCIIGLRLSQVVLAGSWVARTGGPARVIAQVMIGSQT